MACRRIDFKKFAASSSAIALLGFNIIHDGEDLGEILEVIEQPHQVLCAILLNGELAFVQDDSAVDISEEFARLEPRRTTASQRISTES